MRSLVLLLSAAVACAATLAMPNWLAPFPGATANTQASNGLIESSYSAAAKPAEIVAHYQKELSAAGLQSQVNDDGFGISMKASAPECDLLIRVREREDKSLVSVNCSEKSSATTAQSTYLPAGGGPSGTANRSSPKNQADWKANQQQIAAEFQAKREQFIANMKANAKKFDQPVYPTDQSKIAPIPLHWPSWLVTAKGADHGLQVERKKYVSGLEYLETNYKTSAPMSEILEFYKGVLSANGYTVRQSRLSTGSTSTHIQQNAQGSVEAAAYPNGKGNGSIVIRADLSRMFLNEPIAVRLSVSVYQDRN